MITTAIYFDIVWFGFTGVDLQPQVMSPRVFSSRLKEVVHKGLLPRVLLLSQLHFTCKRRWLIFHKAIRTASIICLLPFIVHGISSSALPAQFIFHFQFGRWCRKYHLHKLFGYFGWRWSRFAALRLCNFSNRLCYILWTNFDYKLCKNVRSLARPFSTHLIMDGFIISSLTTTSWIFVCLRLYDDVIGLGGASKFLLWPKLLNILFVPTV